MTRWEIQRKNEKKHIFRWKSCIMNDYNLDTTTQCNYVSSLFVFCFLLECGIGRRTSESKCRQHWMTGTQLIGSVKFSLSISLHMIVFGYLFCETVCSCIMQAIGQHTSIVSRWLLAYAHIQLSLTSLYDQKAQGYR